MGRGGVWQNPHLLLLPFFSPLTLLLLIFLLLLHDCSVERRAVCLLRKDKSILLSCKSFVHHIQQIRTALFVKNADKSTYPGPRLLYVDLSQELVAHDSTCPSQLLITVLTVFLSPSFRFTFHLAELLSQMSGIDQKMTKISGVWVCLLGASLPRLRHHLQCCRCPLRGQL